MAKMYSRITNNNGTGKITIPKSVMEFLSVSFGDLVEFEILKVVKDDKMQNLQVMQETNNQEEQETIQ